MTTGIAVLWWIFLGLAVAVTLTDVYLAGQVVLLSRGIRRLTRETREAASRLGPNTAVGGPLTHTAELVATVGKQTGELYQLAGAVVARLLRGRA